MLDLFAAACARNAVTLHYAVLRAPIAVVQQRVRDRTVEPEHAGALADAAVVEDLWTQFESLGVDGATGSTSGRRGPREVAEEIDRRLRAGEFRLETEG